MSNNKQSTNGAIVISNFFRLIPVFLTIIGWAFVLGTTYGKLDRMSEDIKLLRMDITRMYDEWRADRRDWEARFNDYRTETNAQLVEIWKIIGGSGNVGNTHIR